MGVIVTLRSEARLDSGGDGARREGGSVFEGMPDLRSKVLAP